MSENIKEQGFSQLFPVQPLEQRDQRIEISTVSTVATEVKGTPIRNSASLASVRTRSSRLRSRLSRGRSIL